MAFGKNLSDILTQKNMSVADLSKATNISYNTLYSLIKRDSNNISLENLKKISDVLGTDATYTLLDEQTLNSEQILSIAYKIQSLALENSVNVNDGILTALDALSKCATYAINSRTNASINAFPNIDFSGLSANDIKELQNYADYLKYKHKFSSSKEHSTTE